MQRGKEHSANAQCGKKMTAVTARRKRLKHYKTATEVIQPLFSFTSLACGIVIYIIKKSAPAHGKTTTAHGKKTPANKKKARSGYSRAN